VSRINPTKGIPGLPVADDLLGSILNFLQHGMEVARQICFADVENGHIPIIRLSGCASRKGLRGEQQDIPGSLLTEQR